MSLKHLQPLLKTFPLGTIDVRAGAAAVEAIEVATRLAMQGELDAITTAPICKAAINRTGRTLSGTHGDACSVYEYTRCSDDALYT